jgi:hypothetical protein
MSKTDEERRKDNAARQATLRARRDAAGECRTCGAPAVVSARTGRLAKQCSRHLAADKERKEVLELTWVEPEVHTEDQADDELAGCYRLPWIGAPSATIPLYWYDDPRITG